ncbi:MAG: oligosaccharide flippase family protein, partial [Bacteroidetes bacterium]|nr:oligosaccharide flippase family protein [Bacteroidota bacterium]
MFLKILKRSEFTRNVATLLTGTVIAQALPVLIYPVLTRLYKPEELGFYGFYMAVLGIFAIVANARFELAIVLPSERKEAINVLAIALLFNFGVTLISFFAIFLFSDLLMSLFNSEGINLFPVFLLYLIPVSVFLSGINQAFNYWSSRNKTFKMNALSRISQSGGNVVIAAGLGLLSFGPLGLVLGYITGQFLSAIVLLGNFISIERIKNIKNYFLTEQLKQTFKKYKSFAFVNTPHALLSSFQDNGIVFLITFFFSSTTLG